MIRGDPFTARSQTQLLSRRSRTRGTPPLTLHRPRPSPLLFLVLLNVPFNRTFSRISYSIISIKWEHFCHCRRAKCEWMLIVHAFESSLYNCDLSKATVIAISTSNNSRQAIYASEFSVAMEQRYLVIVK